MAKRIKAIPTIINKEEFCNSIKRRGSTNTSLLYAMPLTTVNYYRKVFKIKSKGSRKNEQHCVYKFV